MLLPSKKEIRIGGDKEYSMSHTTSIPIPLPAQRRSVWRFVQSEFQPPSLQEKLQVDSFIFSDQFPKLLRVN